MGRQSWYSQFWIQGTLRLTRPLPSLYQEPPNSPFWINFLEIRFLSLQPNAFWPIHLYVQQDWLSKPQTQTCVAIKINLLKCNPTKIKCIDGTQRWSDLLSGGKKASYETILIVSTNYVQNRWINKDNILMVAFSLSIRTYDFLKSLSLLYNFYF